MNSCILFKEKKKKTIKSISGESNPQLADHKTAANSSSDLQLLGVERLQTVLNIVYLVFISLLKEIFLCFQVLSIGQKKKATSVSGIYKEPLNVLSRL